MMRDRMFRSEMHKMRVEAARANKEIKQRELDRVGRSPEYSRIVERIMGNSGGNFVGDTSNRERMSPINNLMPLCAKLNRGERETLGRFLDERLKGLRLKSADEQTSMYDSPKLDITTVQLYLKYFDSLEENPTR